METTKGKGFQWISGFDFGFALWGVFTSECKAEVWEKGRGNTPPALVELRGLEFILYGRSPTVLRRFEWTRNEVRGGYGCGNWAI